MVHNESDNDYYTDEKNNKKDKKEIDLLEVMDKINSIIFDYSYYEPKLINVVYAFFK